MYADGVSMENIIKWADADENLVKAVIAEYKESRAQKKYMNERMTTCIEDDLKNYIAKDGKIKAHVQAADANEDHYMPVFTVSGGEEND